MIATQSIPPLTTRAKPSTKLTARLATVEDPRDVYRVFVPARGTITVRTTAASGAALALWGQATQTVMEETPNSNRLARGVSSKGIINLTYKNNGRAKTLYLAVTLAPRVPDATYTIAVTAR